MLIRLIKTSALLAAILLLAMAGAQDNESGDASGDVAPPEDSAEGETAADAAADDEEQDDEEEVDDSDLDEQSYESDEEDFTPTEEIPADEPIPFPTNI